MVKFNPPNPDDRELTLAGKFIGALSNTSTGYS
jgi:hypothetical protein